MAKSKKEYICQTCEKVFAQWFGRCPSCQSWGSLEEHMRIDLAENKRNYSQTQHKIIPLNQQSSLEERMPLSNKEMHRVLGGGLTLGSVVLLSGMPGIGKSTLLLQLLGDLSNQDSRQKQTNCMYISGEESALQIQKRAQRLHITSDSIYLVCQTQIDQVLEAIEKNKPSVVVIDSIQTLYHPNLGSIPGSISQVREVSDRLVRFAKEHQVSMFIVGHVTKEGSIAGPMHLEHLVDTVLQFEGTTDHPHRILRTLKNRFGPTHEIGVFEMREQGLIPIDNPSQYFTARKEKPTSGSVVFPAIEGSRVWMVEVQALVTQASYGTSIRNAVGMDKNRLTMLLAILEKRANIQLVDQDIYINVVGGLKITEPALDVAVLACLLSSFYDKIFYQDAMVFGEVGLSGEIRSTQHFETRLREASKLGIQRVFAPVSKNADLSFFEGKIHTLSEIKDLLDLF